MKYRDKPKCDKLLPLILVFNQNAMRLGILAPFIPLIFVKKGDKSDPLIVAYTKNVMISGLSSPIYPSHFEKTVDLASHVTCLFLKIRLVQKA